MTNSSKFFAVDSLTDQVIGTFDSHDAAAGACQDATREDDGDGDRYEVQASGENEIVEIGPSIGDCSDEEYQAACERLERCYSRVEGDTRYSVSVRPARAGEAGGTYYRKANGNLQILGYSLEVPEDLRELQERAFALFCSGEEV